MSDRRDTVLRKVQIERAEQEEKKRAKHTPGPWYLDEGSIVSDGETAEVRQIWEHGGKLIALVVWPDGTYRERMEANARLIEAAPNLLDALEEIAAGRLDHEHDPDAFHARARSTARAAIAKARGQS